jgi:hypothetical protein
MAKKQRKPGAKPPSAVPDVDHQRGGSALALGEDADSILDAGLGIIRRDLAVLGALLEEHPRVLTIEEASSVAGYVRALGAVSRSRAKGGNDLGKRSMAELVAEALKVPEFREALAGLES